MQAAVTGGAGSPSADDGGAHADQNLKPTLAPASTMQSSITRAASGVACTLALPVLVLRKSAPSASAMREAAAISAGVFSSPLSRITFSTRPSHSRRTARSGKEFSYEHIVGDMPDELANVLGLDARPAERRHLPVELPEQQGLQGQVALPVGEIEQGGGKAQLEVRPLLQPPFQPACQLTPQPGAYRGGQHQQPLARVDVGRIAGQEANQHDHEQQDRRDGLVGAGEVGAEDRKSVV